MTTLLGESVEFWARVRAAMRKANVSTPEELEYRLGVSPPLYEVREDTSCGKWAILERRPLYGSERVIGWGGTKSDAESILAALRRPES